MQLAKVILKPDPGRPQELYLGSLEALGIDTRAHDLRFVEDNWENPTLGAWGLGWEVWMDGEPPGRQQSCICRVSITSQPKPAYLGIMGPPTRLPPSSHIPQRCDQAAAAWRTSFVPTFARVTRLCLSGSMSLGGRPCSSSWHGYTRLFESVWRCHAQVRR